MIFPLLSRLRTKRADRAVQASLIEPLEDRRLLSAATLIKDINPGPGHSGPSHFVSIGDTYYFTADDGVHGRELWKTDGTTDGTTLVRDLLPGPESSMPSNLTEFKGQLYLLVSRGYPNRGLWKSDGTTEGTVFVSNLRGSIGTELTVAGDHLYFTDEAGDALWKSDGTTEGTYLWRYYRGQGGWDPGRSSVRDLTEAGGRLFYSTAPPGDTTDVWMTDGTDVYSIDINASGNAAPSSLVEYGGALYVYAISGSESGVWRVDPETREPTLIHPGGYGMLRVAGGQLFYADWASDTLWATDGTTPGTRRVELPSAERMTSPVAGGTDTLAFGAWDPSANTYGLWITDGTPERTRRLMDLGDWRNGTHPSLFAADQALFVVRDGKLWRADTSVGSSGEVLPFPSDSLYAYPLAYLDGSLFLIGDDGGGMGWELWSVGLFGRASVTLAPSKESSIAGEAVTLTATVRSATAGGATPTGHVRFLVDGRSIGKAPVDTNGVAVFTAAGFKGGMREMEAVYLGDGAYASSGARITHPVSKRTATRVEVLPGSASVPYGSPAVVTVVVSAAEEGVSVTPGGIVTVRVGQKIKAVATLDAAGKAVVEIALALGTKVISAEYGGDGSFAGGAVGSATVEVVRTPVTVTTAPPMPSSFGVPFTMFVGVSGGGGRAIDAGTVEIREVETGALVGTTEIQESSGVLVRVSRAGTVLVRAHYVGSETALPGVSEPVALNVPATPTAVTVYRLATPFEDAGAPELVAEVTALFAKPPWPYEPTPVRGEVVFRTRDASGEERVIGRAAAKGGKAILSLEGLRLETHRFFASYEGRGGYAASESGWERVDPRVQTETTIETGGSARVGQRATLVAHVRKPDGVKGSPGGVVRFFDDNGEEYIGKASVVDGRAVLRVKLKPGRHLISAAYYGDSTFTTSEDGGGRLSVYHRTTVDLLVAYTRDAEMRLRGKRIKELARMAVDVANDALARSRIKVSVRLVRVQQLGYSESGNYETDLGRLAKRGDGHLDEVHALRTKYGADLVSLFVADAGADDTIGMAYQMKNPAAGNDRLGFSVVYAQTAAHGYTLAHELGHNFGASHDEENDTIGGELPYSHGFRFEADGVLYRDIMSYEPGEMIGYFSNPRVFHRGVPIGDPESADVARLINETGRIVARYRKERVRLGDEVG